MCKGGTRVSFSRVQFFLVPTTSKHPLRRLWKCVGLSFCNFGCKFLYHTLQNIFLYKCHSPFKSEKIQVCSPVQSSPVQSNPLHFILLGELCISPVLVPFSRLWLIPIMAALVSLQDIENAIEIIKKSPMVYRTPLLQNVQNMFGFGDQFKLHLKMENMQNTGKILILLKLQYKTSG